MNKKILLISGFIAGIMIITSTVFAAEVNSNTNTSSETNSSLQATQPVQICEYTAPRVGCNYVAGPNYNSKTQCGLVLKCDEFSNDLIQSTLICEYPAPKYGCSYLHGPNYDKTTQCGLVLNCDINTPIDPITSKGDSNFSGSSSGSTEGTKQAPVTNSGTMTSSIGTSKNGECDSADIKSTDGVYCIKNIHLIMSPTTTSVGKTNPTIDINSKGSTTTPSMITEGNQSMPTMFISSETKGSVSFGGSTKEVSIQNPSVEGDIKIAPKEGFRVMIENKENSISIEKNATDGSVTISRGGVISSVAKTDTLKVEGDKVSLSGSEVKIMPDMAVYSVNAELKGTPMIKKVELKTTTETNGQETKNSYEVTTTKEAKIFGLFKVSVPTVSSVDAQTGVVLSVDKPWWNFITF